MLEQIAFFLACGAVWAFFHFSTGQQRHNWFQVAIWLVLAFGTCGFLWEAVNQGRIPIVW